MQHRNTFVISRALRNFLSASIMTSLAGQLAVTTDAVIVSHMIGPDAISAINVVMPLTMLFSCASILIGLGAGILIARAIGNHDNKRICRIFTTSLILLTIAGVAVSALTYFNCGTIISAICDNPRIAPLALEYAEVTTAGAFFLILSNGINYFVSTDGSPSLVAKGVVTASIANILLDIFFVHLWGISGSALATVAHYVITLLIVSTHFFKKSSSYRLVNPLKGIGGYIARNIYEGLPLMLGNLILGSAVFIINSMILGAAGADGMYIWTVCLQVLMITFVVLNGVGNAMLSIGGVLVGEKDYRGVRILTILSIKLVCGVLALFVLFVLLFPEALAYMFGADTDGMNVEVNAPLRIFSLLLIPFAVTLIMRFLFQILEYRVLSLALSVGQLVGIIISLWLFIEFKPEDLWWSFPVSAVLLILFQFGATYAMSLKKRGISPVTLIPHDSTIADSTSFSSGYSEDSILNAIEEIKRFLGLHGIPKESVDKNVHYCCKAMNELLKYTDKGKRSFDIHIRIAGEEIHTVLRDAGKRITILLPEDGNTPNIEQKYMYGQNVIFIKA